MTDTRPHDSQITDLLTDLERDAIGDAGRLWNKLCQIVDTGSTRAADLSELVAHIHAIQHTVMSQAAARAYPEELRLLGGSLEDVTR